MVATPQPANSSTPHHQAALRYAACGWRVFPLHTPTSAGRCSCGKAECKDVGKHPRTEHGLLDATTDEATIRHWWARWPNANLGIATGAASRLAVLDVDPENGGDDALAELERAHGSVPQTIRALTGGNGTHFYWHHPGLDVRIKNSASQVGPGLDIRADGGYVVAPPSLHESGRRYVWDVGAHPDDLAPQPIPEWLLARITSSDLANGHHPVAPIPERIPEKQRNVILTSLAGTMRRRGFSEGAILAALLHENGVRCDPPLEESEVRQIGRSVGRYSPQGVFSESSSRMLGGSEETRLEIIPSTQVPPPDGSSAEGELGPFVPPPPSVVLLSGETSAGKTVLAYNVALALAEGHEFCGLRASAPKRVLYVDLESPEPVHRELVEPIGRSKNLAFIRYLPRALNSPEGMASLRRAIQEWAAEMVVIDPLPLAWPVQDENGNAEADWQMQALKRLAVEMNLLLLVLWNMGEGNVKEKFRARGATARLDRADLGLNYTEVTETTRQLKIVKSRYGTLGMSLTVRFAGDLGFEAVESTEDRIPSKVAEYQARAKAFIADGKKERRELIAAGLDDENTLDRALHLLVLAGELVRVRRGFYDLPVSSFPANIGGKGKEEDSRDEDGHELGDSYLTPLGAEALRLWPGARIEPLGSG